MAVELAELVESLRGALNVPNAAQPLFDFTDEDDWINALATGFWRVKSRGRAVGLFADYRLNADSDQIVNIVDDTIDMDREDQELVVLQTGMTVVESMLLQLPTHTVDKAGPVEVERERSSTVLRQILQDKRAELEQALTELGAGTSNATRSYVVDSILSRSGYGTTPLTGTFIN